MSSLQILDLHRLLAIACSIAVAVLVLSLEGVARAQPPEPFHASPMGVHPEGETGKTVKPVLRARHMMAVTAHPLASDAALSILDSGGSAVDAAIAAQAVLALVEPQSSGVGGGGFLLHYDPARSNIQAYDGRETAPAHAQAHLFIREDGSALSFQEAAVGGRSVGVPGLVRVLELAHTEHGKLPWSSLFAPAIRLAREGFPVSARLHTLLSRERWLSADPEARALFYDARGEPVRVGHLLRNQALADTLEAIAQQGADALYRGPIAHDIAERVRTHPTNPGHLSVDDLSNYRPVRRDGLCSPVRSWLLCGMPPPSSGAIAIAQILGIYDRLSKTPLQQGPVAPLERSALRIHRFTDAVRLAFADRDRWVGDPLFADVPVAALLAPAYLDARAKLIGERSLDIAPPGEPLAGEARARLNSSSTFHSERDATTHLSIVDAAGRAVSLTSSIEDAFGSRVMVRGFLLNNQLTDFSWRSSGDGPPEINRVQPGKRPRSSMSPTLVFRNTGAAGFAKNLSAGQAEAYAGSRPLVMVLGSPGGASIISYVARTLIDVLIDGIPLQQAIEAPHAGSRNGPTELEADPSAAALSAALVARGHRVRVGPMTSGLHGIIRLCDATGTDCVLESGIDPRREGAARGR
jgi:gamma-glutamyltranspeptidase/glutathione hydrolase